MSAPDFAPIITLHGEPGAEVRMDPFLILRALKAATRARFPNAYEAAHDVKVALLRWRPRSGFYLFACLMAAMAAFTRLSEQDLPALIAANAVLLACFCFGPVALRLEEAEKDKRTVDYLHEECDRLEAARFQAWDVVLATRRALAAAQALHEPAAAAQAHP